MPNLTLSSIADYVLLQWLTGAAVGMPESIYLYCAKLEIFDCCRPTFLPSKKYVIKSGLFDEPYWIWCIEFSLFLLWTGLQGLELLEQ